MKRIVILGGGYAGVNAAKTLEKKLKGKENIEVILINKTDYHIMMTSLHEVAGGRIEKDCVKIPLREIFLSGKTRLMIDQVTDIDFSERTIIFLKHPSIKYDYLILATGSEPTYFGIDGAKENSLPLWSLNHAVKIRHYILESFKKAAEDTDKEQRKILLTFMVAGGGFTGIEFAGELGEWKSRLCKAYGIDPKEVSIKILEACPTILSNMNQHLIQKAEKKLYELGIEVLTNSKIIQVEPDRVHLADGSKISGKIIWSAGIEGNEMNGRLDLDANPRLRIPVNEQMNTKYQEVYSIGDSVYFKENGRPIPQIVETALQTSETAVDNILAEIKKQKKKSFHSNYHGSMVSIGSTYGVAKISGIGLHGKLAILMKHLVNIHYFMGLGTPRFTKNYLKTQFFHDKYHLSL